MGEAADDCRPCPGGVGLNWYSDSMKAITFSQSSFRGAAEGREPGIHNLGRWLWIPGSAP
jgi:hypothetical protein